MNQRRLTSLTVTVPVALIVVNVPFPGPGSQNALRNDEGKISAYNGTRETRITEDKKMKTEH